jgi:hypothetical protein
MITNKMREYLEMSTITGGKIETNTINACQINTTDPKSKYFLSPERSEECKWVCGYCGALHPKEIYKCDHCGARRRGHEEQVSTPFMEVVIPDPNMRHMTKDEESKFLNDYKDGVLSKKAQIDYNRHLIRELYENKDKPENQEIIKHLLRKITLDLRRI